MNEKNEWYKLIERNKNFHGNHIIPEKEAEQNASFYIALNVLRKTILSALDTHTDLDRKLLLNTIFSYIYDFICISSNHFSIFGNPSPLYENAFEACYFTTLCMFLHHTTRIKGKTFEAFIKDNNPLYNVAEPNESLLLSETITFRQSRYRLLSSRPIYIRRKEWDGMSADSEHEWSIKYDLNEADITILDTFKRIGNLYKGINAEINKPELNMDNLRKSYKSFQSKIKKLYFQNYLELQSFLLAHVRKNEAYYGINLYRYEKENRLYIISSEIRKLLECKTEAAEKELLTKFSILNGIYFPKVYEKLGSISNPHHLCMETTNFINFLNCIVTSSKLIIDELVEANYLGDDWNLLFLHTINQMAESVFYNPSELDFSFPDSPNVQEKFEKILTEHVRDLLLQKTGEFFD